MNGMLLIILTTASVLLAMKARGLSFVQTSGTHFVVDGNYMYVNGFNAYWLMYLASDPYERCRVTHVLEQAAAGGLNVCRTWAFNDGGYRALQTSPGAYNEDVFRALDFAIHEAGRHGIRLVLSLANNYKDFGGKAQYVQWGRNAGQTLESDDDFFTIPVVKEYYKSHVKTVLTRVNNVSGIAYKDDPAIFAWELMNEPRCEADSSCGDSIKKWIEEMAAHVKSIDRNHLLEVGLEGFYGDSTPERKRTVNPVGLQAGTDFIRNNRITGIDFATVHAYPDIWLPGANEQTQLSFLKKWMDSHIEDGDRILRKPVLFAEFGKSLKDPRFSAAQRDRFLGVIYSSIYTSAKNGGAGGGGLVWHLIDDGMDGFADGYQIILPASPSTANLIFSQSQRLLALSQKSNRTN